MPRPPQDPLDRARELEEFLRQIAWPPVLPQVSQKRNPRVNGRCRNRQVNGRKFTDEVVAAVWKKARPVAGKDPALERIDAFGMLILFDKHGVMTQLGGGWEIDHIRPVALGGTDDLANLQPLQWQNNRWKADIWPDWLDMPMWANSGYKRKRRANRQSPE